MNQLHKNVITRIVILGILIAVLLYLFHPGVGQLHVIINGAPVAEPLASFAAIPTFLVALAITALLSTLLFFGVGLLIFFGVLLLAFIGLALIAPYFSPVLVIVFLVIALMSLGKTN